MIIFVWTFTFYPFLLVPCSMLLNLDHFYYIIESFPKRYVNLPIWLFLHASRFFAMLLSCSEVCRIIPLVVLVFMSWLRTMTRALERLLFISCEKPLPILIKDYNCLQLSVLLVSQFQEGGSFVVLGAGLVLGIFFNFGTIKLFCVLPLYFYIYNPSVSLFIVCSGNLMLTMVHKVYERSEELLRCWPVGTLNFYFGGMRRKYLKKVLKSLRPIRLYTVIENCRFFWFKRNTKITYWSTIFLNTINLLLTFPQEWINEFELLLNVGGKTYFEHEN
jgi:hypothetical protein